MFLVCTVPYSNHTETCRRMGALRIWPFHDRRPGGGTHDSLYPTVVMKGPPLVKRLSPLRHNSKKSTSESPLAVDLRFEQSVKPTEKIRTNKHTHTNSGSQSFRLPFHSSIYSRHPHNALRWDQGGPYALRQICKVIFLPTVTPPCDNQMAMENDLS